MKTHALTVLVVLWFFLSCSIAFAALRDGVRIEADSEVIDVKIGHLVPCATDWNNDGKKDLIVGQFDGGRIRHIKDYHLLGKRQEHFHAAQPSLYIRHQCIT